MRSCFIRVRPSLNCKLPCSSVSQLQTPLRHYIPIITVQDRICRVMSESREHDNSQHGNFRSKKTTKIERLSKTVVTSH
jgi:hypothetical protein